MKNNHSRRKRQQLVAASCLIIWLLLVVLLFIFLANNGGIDGVILNQPIEFFGLMAMSVFFLATGINNLILVLKSTD